MIIILSIHHHYHHHTHRDPHTALYKKCLVTDCFVLLAVPNEILSEAEIDIS